MTPVTSIGGKGSMIFSVARAIPSASSARIDRAIRCIAQRCSLLNDPHDPKSMKVSVLFSPTTMLAGCGSAWKKRFSSMLQNPLQRIRLATRAGSMFIWRIIASPS